MNRYEDEFMMRQRATTIELERRKWCQEYAVSDRVLTLERPDFLRRFDHEQRVTLCLSVFCRGRERIVELPTFTVPVDWWQAFRARWLPKWWLRRHPVQMRELGGGSVKVEAFAMFPELDAMKGRTRIEFYAEPPEWRLP
jgi:hypothetical protein